MVEEGQVPWLGLPVEQVTQFTCYARSDSRKLSGGGYILEAELRGVQNSSGARTGAGGKLLCFFEYDPVIYMGGIISAETGLRASPELAEIYKSQNLGNISLLKEPLCLTAYPRAGELVSLGRKSSVWRIREALSRGIEQRCYKMGEDSGGLLLALLLGNRDGLSIWESRIFREAGCSHILALSGMHLGILSALILLILHPLPGRKPAFIVSSVIVLVYLILTGFGISLVRAALMYFLFGLSNAFYRKTSAFDILLLSFVVLTAAAPSTFYTLSFQLSFLAVAGILTAAPEINQFLKPWLPAALRLPLSCSAGAQLLVIPLLLPTFGVIYPVGLIAGIIIAPMVTLFIWSGLIFLITGLKPVSIFSDLIYKAICRVAETAAAAPSVSYDESALWLVPLLAGLIILLSMYSIRRRMLNGISGKL
ncbi:MAG: ComEC/Rec2 family competence protein [Spirochaetales bacterium]|nr:ComEC/Rec2 family competence protein [Spirochaetales bacterium]